ncbi:hypothetical protein BD779DRAFT_1471589 [Infundibulicybe gibba]|nr:hypothetical protein BD779DRAFT_1471589 [Infundibulicybe gibba]
MTQESESESTRGSPGRTPQEAFQRFKAIQGDSTILAILSIKIVSIVRHWVESIEKQPKDGASGASHQDPQTSCVRFLFSLDFHQNPLNDPAINLIKTGLQLNAWSDFGCAFKLGATQRHTDHNGTNATLACDSPRSCGILASAPTYALIIGIVTMTSRPVHYSWRSWFLGFGDILR